MQSVNTSVTILLKMAAFDQRGNVKFAACWVPSFVLASDLDRMGNLLYHNVRSRLAWLESCE